MKSRGRMFQQARGRSPALPLMFAEDTPCVQNASGEGRKQMVVAFLFFRPPAPRRMAQRARCEVA